MLTLDGSTLEGGGQLVRVALSLSSICKLPVRITSIRANRSANARRGGTHRPSSGRAHANQGGRGKGLHVKETQKAGAAAGGGGGLKESHLAAVNWLGEKCRADVHGAGVGETEVVFRPTRSGRVQPLQLSGEDTEEIALKNPGSVWLIWQAIFPYVVFNLPDCASRGRATSMTDGLKSPDSASDFRIILRGGTNVPKSPSSEYVQQVFAPLCQRIGLPTIEVKVAQRGWAGSAPVIGEVEIVVKSTNGGVADGSVSGSNGFSLRPFTLTDRGDITKIEMTIIAGSQETYSMLETQLPTALVTLGSTGAFSSDLPITTHTSSTSSSGDERRLYVLLVAHTSNGYRLGRDCLSTGRKITNDSERRQIVAQVVGTVTRELVAECRKGGCVDEYAEDQIVVFQALAHGRSVVDNGSAQLRGNGNGNGKGKGKGVGARGVDGGGEGSLHTRTVRWVCEEMLGSVFDDEGGCAGRPVDARNTEVDGATDTMARLET